MNAETAIEILEKEEEDTFMGSEKEWKNAVKLGYEALKRELACRIRRPDLPWPLLPGETEY